MTPSSAQPGGDAKEVVHTSKRIDAEISDEETVTAKPAWRRWYRSTLFNIILLGTISLTQSGLWAALNNTGAGGQQEPYLVIGSTAILFGIMTFGCPLCGILVNRYGPKPLLIVATLGLVPYSASLYMNNRYGVEWFVLFSAVLVGISGAAFWTTETAVAVTYAPLHQLGIYVAIGLGLREFGQILGAAIALSVNHSIDHLGKVSYTTYLIFIGIECLGLPLALLFSSPRKAIRPDGTTVASSARYERASFAFKDFWSVLTEKWMLLLIPVSICFQWNNTYQSIYLTTYFTVRTRTLAALVSGVAVTIADFGTGLFLDTKNISRPTKARAIVVGFSACMSGLLAWQLSNEYKYSGTPGISIDWTSPGFGRAFAVHVLLRFFNEAHIVVVFWLVGAFTSDPREVTAGCGIVNGFEALGSTIANGIGSARIAPKINLWIAFAVFMASIIPTLKMAWMVPEKPRAKGLRADQQLDLDRM